MGAHALGRALSPSTLSLAKPGDCGRSDRSRLRGRSVCTECRTRASRHAEPETDWPHARCQKVEEDHWSALKHQFRRSEQGRAEGTSGAYGSVEPFAIRRTTQSKTRRRTPRVDDAETGSRLQADAAT